MFLKRIRVLSEDAFGPPFRYSMNEVLLIISTLVEVLANKTLASTSFLEGQSILDRQVHISLYNVNF